ncbi:MAG: tRNA (guanine-N7-)-methyltransferase [Rickettsiales bacterium]|jgi:tRNA (guanine-N7-)-methyltransferase
MENPNKPQYVRSFGRVRARKLSPHKKDLFANLLLKYKIEDSGLSDLKPDSKPIYLEIGFGFGDFLYENAKNNPDIFFIGCEPHVNGVVNVLAKLEIEPLDNLKIYVGDSRILLQSAPDQLFDKIYILNPDPWPKSKHFKRRLINVEILELLHLKIKQSEKLIIATDSDSYKSWVMSQYFLSGLWEWTAISKADWEIFPDGWVKTKYQKKAEIAGRTNVFLEFLAKN